MYFYCFLRLIQSHTLHEVIVCTIAAIINLHWNGGDQIKLFAFLAMSAAGQQDPVVFLITTTYQRQTQKADLVSLCHTLKHVPSLVWIVVENSASQSPVIQAVLGRCNISAIHLTVQTPEHVRITRKNSPKVTGVAHRNAGLRWLREYCSRQDCWGVVFFGDDDDRYDLKLFDEVSCHLEL